MCLKLLPTGDAIHTPIRHIQVNTRRLTNVVLMLSQVRRRCANNEPALVQHLSFAGMLLPSILVQVTIYRRLRIGPKPTIYRNL